MSQTWLPGDTRQRIQDLIKDSNSTQADLAAVIGLSESALSRYLKGQTEMLGDGYIIRIAKHFNVSTDFLLGETDIPKRSCQAPRCFSLKSQKKGRIDLFSKSILP